jgi:co-chaperonin GroES (HSP10)
MIDRGARIGNETLTTVSADERIRPLRDQIILEPLEWQPSKIIAVAYGGKPLRGRVLAIGPGVHPRKYDGPKGKRTKSWLSKSFRPCDVKIGDIVELGGLELRGYLFPTVWWGQKEVVICREADVAVVCEQPQEQASANASAA